MSTGPPTTLMRQLLYCDHLIDGTGSDPLPDQAILIEEGRILWVGPIAKVGLTERDGAREHDLRPATIIPGLIDAHVHLTFNAAPDHASVRDGLTQSSESQLTLLAVANAQVHLAGGVTTLRDVGGPGLLTLTIRDALNSGQVLGPRIRAAGPAITPTGGHLHYLGAVADGQEAVARRAREVLDAGADLVKVCASGGIMTPGSDPLVPHYSAAELRAAVEVARSRDRIVAAHALCSEAVVRCVEAGVRSIEHCTWQESPGEFAFQPEIAAQMVAKGTVVGLTYAGLGQARYREEVLGHRPEPSLGDWKARMARRYESERAMIDAGVPYVLHSDAGVRATPFGAFWMVLASACFELGLAPLEAIHAVTSTAADLLGMSDQVGRIAPGLRADLLVVRGNAAEDIAVLTQPWRVIKDGQVVAEDGSLRLPGPFHAEARGNGL